MKHHIIYFRKRLMANTNWKFSFIKIECSETNQNQPFSVLIDFRRSSQSTELGDNAGVLSGVRLRLVGPDHLRQTRPPRGDL